MPRKRDAPWCCGPPTGARPAVSPRSGRASSARYARPGEGRPALKSNFENALDLLTHCRIVFLRKSSGSLDLLTEAQVVQRFPRLRSDLAALYGAYYVAELLESMTEEYDPHPLLFDAALEFLEALGTPRVGEPPTVGLYVVRFELVLLREVGYSPALDGCASCGGPVDERRLAFSCAAGGLVCPNCVGQIPRPSGRCRRPAARCCGRCSSRPKSGRASRRSPRGASGSGPIRDVFAGPTAAVVALPGELRP